MPVPSLLNTLVLATGLNPLVLLSDERLLSQAEAAYRQGVKTRAMRLTAAELFAQAADCYEELRRRGARNVALYRNLAQSYLQGNKLAHAILACHRGLRLDPNNAELQGLLEEARNEVEYATYGRFAKPPVEHWPPWLPRPSLRFCLVMLLVVFSLACASVTRWRMTQQGGYFWLGVLTVGVTMFLGIGLAFLASERAQDKAQPLVVIAPERDSKVVLHKGNGWKYPCYDAVNSSWEEGGDSIPTAATPLFAGVEARLRFEKGDWLQIELASGEIGWIRRSEALVDSP
jgi:tetratricopeptide (TPR) repeat protein